MWDDSKAETKTDMMITPACSLTCYFGQRNVTKYLDTILNEEL